MHMEARLNDQVWEPSTGVGWAARLTLWRCCPDRSYAQFATLSPRAVRTRFRATQLIGR